MRCPLSTRCQAALSADIRAARDAHRRTIREDAEALAALDAENVRLRIEVDAMRRAMKAGMTEAAKRGVSGYRSHPLKPEHSCADCAHIYEARLLGREHSRQHRCAEYDHRVNARLGGCPGHSALRRGAVA